MKYTQANALISAAILAKVEAGMSMHEAYDVVLGAGAYEQQAGQVYALFRKRQGLPVEDQKGGSDA